MSGGIDSSALASGYSILRPGMGRGYGIIYGPDLAGADERSYLDDIEQSTRINVHRIDGARYLPFEVPYPLQDEPEPWAYSARNWATLNRITDDYPNGATVIAGEGGDELLLGQIFAIADQMHRGEKGSAERDLATMPDPAAAWRVLEHLLTGGYTSAGTRAMQALDDIAPWLSATYLEQHNVVARMAAVYPRIGTPGKMASVYSQHLYGETGAAGRVQCGGWHEDMGRRLGHRIVYPFFDPDLVAFVWGLPPHLIRSDGVEKVILRRAFPELPQSIAQRPDKADALTLLHAGLAKSRPTINALTNSSPLIDLGIVDPAAMRRGIDRYYGGDLRLGPSLWASYAVNDWLIHNL